MNVRQFHSISYLDLKYFRDTLEGKVDIDPDVLRKTDRMGDCFLLTFFEYGLSTPVEKFNDGQKTPNLKYNYGVYELLFYLTNDILMLCEKNADSHVPILVTIEPSDMSNQEKKAYLTEEAKRQGAMSRKERQKANKAKGKARATARYLLFIKKENFFSQG